MTQNFENHAKFVPGFHVAVLGILGINLIWSIYRLFQAFSAESAISLLLAIALILLAFYARTFALAVQDRVIRLECAFACSRYYRPTSGRVSLNSA